MRDLANILLPPDEDRLLSLIILPLVEAAAVEAGALAASLSGGDALTGRDPALERLLAEAAEHVRGINEETREAIRRTLVQAAAEQLSPTEIARRLRAVVEETYRGRAETIARTELARATQGAAHDRYEDAGITEVDIIDGPECGWTRHDDPDKADGTRRTIAAARAYPISHPNCRRVSLPVVRARRTP